MTLHDSQYMYNNSRIENCCETIYTKKVMSSFTSQSPQFIERVVVSRVFTISFLNMVQTLLRSLKLQLTVECDDYDNQRFRV